MCSSMAPSPVQYRPSPTPLPPALPAPSAPSSCRSGAEQYSHLWRRSVSPGPIGPVLSVAVRLIATVWEGAKSCGSFVRAERHGGFHEDLLESHSASANCSMSFVLPFSGYPVFVRLHLRRFFFFWHKVITANPGRPQHLLSEAVTAIAAGSRRE